MARGIYTYSDHDSLDSSKKRDYRCDDKIIMLDGELPAIIYTLCYFLFLCHLLHLYIMKMGIQLSLSALKKGDYRCDKKIMMLNGKLRV